MDDTQREHQFQAALDAMRAGRRDRALARLQRLVELGSQDPRHMSFYGFLLASQGKNPKRGQEYCERAVLIGADRPQVYINLSRLYAGSGRRIKAIKVLRDGLRLLPGHKGLSAEIQRLSPRKPPVLSTLDRDHFLNRNLGKVRARVFGSGRSEKLAR
ncbi:MAG: hypothetical protein GY716_24565 [bacterium]|nr:hypothetical protein [bacterium]